MKPLLVVAGLRKAFGGGGLARHSRDPLVAVDGVDFELREPGECLALVGESGSGKSTIARCLVRLIEPDAGRVELEGVDWLGLRGEALRRMRPRLQLVFQDPATSLNPRIAIADAVAEPIVVHRGLSRGAARHESVALLERCGIESGLATRLPAQLSGGQRQRVAIARALALQPRVLIADEPVSALDPSMQGQILVLLEQLRRDLGLAMILISHDLAVVETVADRVAVMERGRIVETGPTRQLLSAPQHPTTRALVAAAPRRPTARLATGR